MSEPWGALALLADTSAWARVEHLPEEWLRAVAANRIVTCDLVVLELLYSARTRRDVLALNGDLAALRSLPTTRGVMAAARSAVIELARRGADGHHRVSPADAVIAACATHGGCGVLHYDGHFDRLSQVLGFDSVWVAPAGSVP